MRPFVIAVPVLLTGCGREAREASAALEARLAPAAAIADAEDPVTCTLPEGVNGLRALTIDRTLLDVVAAAGGDVEKRRRGAGVTPGIDVTSKRLQIGLWRHSSSPYEEVVRNARDSTKERFLAVLDVLETIEPVFTPISRDVRDWDGKTAEQILSPPAGTFEGGATRVRATLIDLSVPRLVCSFEASGRITGSVNVLQFSGAGSEKLNASMAESKLRDETARAARSAAASELRKRLPGFEGFLE